MAESDFALSEIKLELEVALVRLGVSHNLTELDLTEVREAADKLFSASIRRKFSGYSGFIDTGALMER